MRNFFAVLLVGLMSFGLAVDHADARRMGGGKSFGSYSRSAKSDNAAPNRTASNAQTQRKPSSGLSRFAGPFAGLLAGGLLASLFFGGAFDGIRFLDILLVAGIAFLVFRFIARRRQATAGGPSQRREQATPAAVFRGSSSGADSQPAAFSPQPEWFDKERFLGGAKEHFMTLQRAWDNNDFKEIQEYVTPERYNLLREERAAQPANTRTEILRLCAELGDIREHDSQAEATVIFHGVLDENGEQNEFNETWHLIRELREDAPWYVQGIEQNPGA